MYIVHLIVDFFELRFEGGHLLAKEGLSVRDVVNVVSSDPVIVLQIKQFSDSRCLTIGTSASAMIASRLTGLSSMLQYASKKPSVSGYYLSCYLRLQDEDWLFLVEAAWVARNPEAAQPSLL